MLPILPFQEYNKVRPLIQPVDFHLALTSILEGISPAHILVDDPTSPTNAFITYKGKAWLLGNPHNTSFHSMLIDTLPTTYYNSLKAHHATAFRLYYHPTTWEEYLPILFPNAIGPTYVYNYWEVDARTKPWNITIPQEYQMHQITKDSLQVNLKNIDYVREETTSERLTIEEFLQHSFGYYLTHHHTIVAWCMSEYNTPTRCELGIETTPPHQQQGLAQLTASTVIHHALQHQITQIGWHCGANNLASNKTAQRLGFSKKHTYPVVIIKIP
jgi:RimJ/RimL family protein N-acetyltransferase